MMIIMIIIVLRHWVLEWFCCIAIDMFMDFCITVINSHLLEIPNLHFTFSGKTNKRSGGKKEEAEVYM